MKLKPLTPSGKLILTYFVVACFVLLMAVLGMAKSAHAEPMFASTKEYSSGEVYQMQAHECEDFAESIIPKQLDYIKLPDDHQYYWEVRSHLLAATYHTCMVSTLREVTNEVEEPTDNTSPRNHW